MSLVINTNIASLNAQQNLTNSGLSLQTSLQRLSSGLRINSAKDDAAGLAISDRFTTQINGLNQAIQNANDGISLAQTADGALQEVTNNLQRIRQLAVQAANATNSTSDRQSLDAEVQQRIAEITRIATQTSFNNRNVLDGTFGNAQFQVGANVGQTISVGLNTSASANAIGSFVNSAGNQVTNTVASTGSTIAGYTLATSAASYVGVNGTAFNGSNFTINGTAVQAAVSSATNTQQSSDSAYAAAQAINATNINGVTASADTKLTFNKLSSGNFLDLTYGSGNTSSIGYTLNINGQDVYSTGAQTGTLHVTVDTAVQAINQYSTTTGVVASKDTTGNLVLEAADGRNIQVKETNTDTVGAGTNNNTLATVFGTSAATVDSASIAGNSSTLTYRGQVTLTSGAAVNLGGTIATAGFTSSVLNASGALSSQSVSTVAGANNTILSVDSALTAIDTLRGTFGAIQNRFQSTIANLGTSTQNLSAARSRVQDADFAAETSNLTRAQILQQAGTSILAQANALPQGVLKLLQ